MTHPSPHSADLPDLPDLPDFPDLADLPDLQIDRALSVLAQAVPSPNLNDRVVQCLSQQQALHSQSTVLWTEADPQRSGVPRVFARGHRTSIPTATALAATAALLVLLPHFVGPKHRQQAHISQALHPSPKLGAPSPPTPSSRVMAGPSAPMLAVGTAGVQTAQTTPPSLATQPIHPAPPPPTLDEAALEDLRSPSHPAPALRPTPQERLVRLMLRRGERIDLAQLDASQTEASALRDQSQFRNFFDPPAPKLPPGANLEPQNDPLPRSEPPPAEPPQ